MIMNGIKSINGNLASIFNRSFESIRTNWQHCINFIEMPIISDDYGDPLNQFELFGNTASIPRAKWINFVIRLTLIGPNWKKEPWVIPTLNAT